MQARADNKQTDLTSSSGYFSVDRCKGRLDGVFAIFVAVLVLGIDVPVDHNFSENGFLAFMKRIGFDVLLYAISVWLIGTYWVQHTDLALFPAWKPSAFLA
ncbi:MAG: TMEM175 family protein [Methylobacter sp.]